MADLDTDHNSLKKDDFMDPLGAKDPLGCAGDDENDGVEFDVSYFLRMFSHQLIWAIVKLPYLIQLILIRNIKFHDKDLFMSISYTPTT